MRSWWLGVVGALVILAPLVTAQESLQNVKRPKYEGFVLELVLTPSVHSIEASWTVDSSVTSLVTYYEVSWDPPDDRGVSSTTTQETHYTISELTACTSYTVTVQPRDANDTDLGASRSLYTHTADGDPPRVNTSSASKVDSSQIAVSWTFRYTFYCSTNFKITWKLSDGELIGEQIVNNQYTYTIQGLSAYTRYSVCVASFSGGVYTEAACDETSTEEGAPDRPRNTTVTGHTSRSLLVTWEEPAHTNGVLSWYYVDWKPMDGGGTALISNTSTTYNITGLSPCTSYTIYLKAMTNHGTGFSDVTYGMTDTEAPASVSDLQVLTVLDDSGSLNVTWTAPSTHCDLQYRVSWVPDDGGGGPVVSSDPAWTIHSLVPWTNYSVCVAACTVDDLCGGEECGVGVTDEDVPGPPTSVKKLQQTSTTILVEWEEPFVANGALQEYMISWSPLDGGGSALVSSSSRQHSITGLNTSATHYNVSVSASTSKGFGVAAVASETPEEYIINLQVETGSNNISLIWNLETDVEAEVVQYLVSWMPADNGGSNTITGRQYTITGLSSCTDYQVSVQPQGDTEADVGAPAQTFTATTEQDPPAVESVTADADVTDSSQLNVSWSLIQPFPCPVTFRVSWEALNQGGSSDRQQTLNNQYYYTLSGLAPYTVYQVCVAARTAAGYDAEQCVQATTQEDVPGRPATISLPQRGPHSLLVAWGEPVPSNGVIIDYVLSWVPDDSGGSASVPNTTHQYYMTGLDPCKRYNIHVSASTSKGNGPSADISDLTGTDAPGPVSNLQVDEVDTEPSQLQVCWEPPDTSCHIQYSITWSLADGGPIAGPGVTNALCFVPTILKTWTRYQVCVTAATLDGKNGPQICAAGRTAEGAPSPPARVSVLSRTSRSLLETWEEPLEPNGIIMYYYIDWRPMDGGGTALVGNTTRSYNITSLNPCISYSIAVKASTMKGMGFSTGNSDVTRSEDPSAPLVYCLPSSADQLTVKWAPASSECPIMNYVVEGIGSVLWSYDTDFRGPVVVDAATTSVQFTDLVPWTDYTIRVKGQIVGEVSGPYNNCSIQTPEALPGPPTHFTCTESNSSALMLSWQSPEEKNGNISHYLLTWEAGNDRSNMTTKYSFTYTTLPGLRSSTTYNLTVQAGNGAGWGEAAVLQANTTALTHDPNEGLSVGAVVGLTIVAVLTLGGFTYGIRKSCHRRSSSAPPPAAAPPEPEIQLEVLREGVVVEPDVASIGQHSVEGDPADQSSQSSGSSQGYDNPSTVEDS